MIPISQMRKLRPTKSSHLPNITQLIMRAWIQTQISKKANSKMAKFKSYIKALNKGLGSFNSQ